MGMLNLTAQMRGGLDFWAEGFHPQFHEGSDFWRLFLDTGEIRELSVYAHAQTPVRTEQAGDLIRVEYDRLTAENGEIFDIGLTVEIRQQDGALHFSASLRNRSDARVNEVQLPVLSAARYGCAPEEEILYSPDGMGVRNPNPRQAVAKKHTEYMSADYKCTLYPQTYPPYNGGGGLSMPWLALETGEYCLYLGEHDPEMAIVNLNTMVPPRGAASELGFSVSHYPAAEPGETVQVGHAVLAVFRGDWREAAAFYKKWAASVWYPDPHRRPAWVNGLTGWQRIICKHQYGEIFFRYADLPRLYREGKAVGLNALLVFGWWKGRFDNNYPELEPDPALGGAEGLRAAVREIQAEGGRVLLYSNGNLIDIKTDFYRDIGAEICTKDIDGNEYREHYRFSNDGTVLRHWGYKSFVTACHCTPQWQQRLVENARLKRSFGVDSVFFDQLGCCCKLCFDKSHPHGSRIDREGRARLDNIRAIQEILTPEEAIGTEWICDRYAAATDYIHGCGGSCSYFPSAYPDLYRETFPETIVSNRFVHDERPDFREHLNYAFVSGLIIDVSIFRGRVCGIAGQPAYGAYLKKLLDWKEAYRRYFYEGIFRSARGLSLPETVRGSLFYAREGGDFIAALWNTGAEEAVFPLLGRTVTIPAGEVTVEAFSE